MAERFRSNFEPRPYVNVDKKPFALPVTNGGKR